VDRDTHGASVGASIAGRACIEPSPCPTLWISEQTPVYEQDGLGAVGHQNPVTADSLHHRVPVARRVAVRTSPSPPWALYHAHTYQNEKKLGRQRSPANSFMLVLCAAHAHCPFLHLRLARSLCSIMYSTLPVLGLPTSVQTHKPPENGAMNEAVARIIYEPK